MRAITSPFTEFSISVTSTGLSSINNTIKFISGWFVVILFPIFYKSIVSPVLEGTTIKPLCPFPIGEIKSIILIEISSYFYFWIYFWIRINKS